MDKELEEAKVILKKYGQEHLLNRYQYLDDEKKEKIIKQIKNIDFDQVIDLFNITTKSVKKLDGEITNIEYVDKSKLSEEEYNKYYEIGKKRIEEGKFRFPRQINSEKYTVTKQELSWLLNGLCVEEIRKYEALKSENKI